MPTVPIGLGPLLKMRQNHKLPSRIVSIYVGDGWKSPDWHTCNEFAPYPFGIVRTDDDVQFLDLRVLTGLGVFIHAEKYTDQVSDLFNAMKKHAMYVCLVCLDWGTDMIEWRKS